MEGDLRGPSAADCEKSYARTGIVPSGSPQLAEGKLRYWKEDGIRDRNTEGTEFR
jgi:hypothetical protein